MKVSLIVLYLIISGFSLLSFGNQKLPDSIQGFKIIYYDYEEDEKFNFSKLKKAEFEELKGYILLELAEIDSALKDPNSQLRNTMATQSSDTFLIKILVELPTEPVAESCKPYMDDSDIDVCAATTVLHVYKDQFCISKSDEYSKMIPQPSCGQTPNASPKKRHKALFSIPITLKLK